MGKRNCESCGRPIVYIKTKNGKYMPCDPKPLQYVAREDGADRLVITDANGETQIIRCELTGNRVGVRTYGLMPHWATCPNAARHREREQRAKSIKNAMPRTAPKQKKQPKTRERDPYEQLTLL